MTARSAERSIVSPPSDIDCPAHAVAAANGDLEPGLRAFSTAVAISAASRGETISAVQSSYPRWLMERPGFTWSEERLGDLSRRMDDGFRRVDEDIREMRTELSALQRTMIQVAAGQTAAILATLVTVLITRA